MIQTKKGLSTVVTTLIIILLVLVAIGIIWVVIKNFITQGTDQIDYATACPQINLQIKSTTCTTSGNSPCNVVVERLAGGTDFDGVTVVISSDTDSDRTDDPNMVNELGSSTISITHTVSAPTKVVAAAYFLNSNGEIQLCPPSGDYELQ